MKMHWATILSMLGCALASAYLVFVEGWDATYAGVTVAGSAIAVCTLLLAILRALSAPTDRADFMRSALRTMRGDLGDFLRMLRMRR